MNINLRNTLIFKQSIKRACGQFYSLFPIADTRPIILNYHSIGGDCFASTSIEDFAIQMDYLKRHFEVVSMADYLLMLKERVNKRCAVITFDDGYEDNYTNAFPVLSRFNLPAIVFLTTGFINKEIDITQAYDTYRGLKPLNWSQIREMSQYGISFGAHTHTHPIMTDIELDVAEDEVLTSKKIIEDNLQLKVGVFAYPNGRKGTYNDKIIDILRAAGFNAACTTRWGCNYNDCRIYELNRIRIDSHDSLEDFSRKVNGQWDFINLINKFA